MDCGKDEVRVKDGREELQGQESKDEVGDARRGSIEATSRRKEGRKNEKHLINEVIVEDKRNTEQTKLAGPSPRGYVSGISYYT